MTLSLLSFVYRRMPIAQRERIAFADRDLPAALAALRESGARDCAILATCNRVELYVDLAVQPRAARALTLDFVAGWHGVARAELEPYAALFEGERAARHLIRVACGLESMVPGEMQILGQVKRAAAQAREAGTLGPGLERLFAAAVGAGRRARRETPIARGPISISHAAVALVARHFDGDLGGRRVILLGSGKMGTIAARQLAAGGARNLLIANRSAERARALACQTGGEALALDALPGALAGADALIASTAAPHLIIRPEHLAPLAGRPMLLVDLAVPRDIDPAVGELPNVTLYDLDGLEAVVRESHRLRNGARARVGQIVEEALVRFRSDRAARRIAPTIVALREHAEQIRREELERLGVERFDPAERELVEGLTRRLMRRLLHSPTVTLRERAATDDAARVEELVRELFALDGRDA